MFTIAQLFFYQHSGGESVVINAAQAERGKEECLMSRKNLFPFYMDVSQPITATLLCLKLFFFPFSPPSSCNPEPIA